MWTQFRDAHAGPRGRSLKWGNILIELPKKKAIKFFIKKFKLDPEQVWCKCCGPRYSIYKWKTLTEATAYERNCFHGQDGYEELDPHPYSLEAKLGRKHIPLKEYIMGEHVLALTLEDIIGE